MVVLRNVGDLEVRGWRDAGMHRLTLLGTFQMLLVCC